MSSHARTVFLGSGGFAVPIVAALADHPAVTLLAVVTVPPRRAAAPDAPPDTPVGVWAATRGMPVLAPARLRDEAAVKQIAALAPDLLVLADYGQIVPPALLELPPHGALNLHPSLLPRHRGASPIAAAIAEGDDVTGVSLMLMDRGLDSGPLIAQRAVPLEGTETSPELEFRLAGMAADLLVEQLAPWLAGATEPVPQRPEQATMTRTLRREDGRLDPLRPAVELERRVRAYLPWPGSFVETDAGRIVVWQAVVHPSDGSSDPGTLLRLGEGGLGLVTADGVLELAEVQPAGGRRMAGAALLRGRPTLAGATVHGAATAVSDE